MAERLRDATSPYLQQHVDNPVDWWPWCPEAFEEARRRDVPVLLSVGYSACHWCHVMAHETFEDQDVARIVNARVVPVKVDREERPDVDAVYMSAVLAMTGHGGWPMTCLLTPDGEPFHCGTYYPRDAFVQLVEAAGGAWRDRRGEVHAVAGQVRDAIGHRPMGARHAFTAGADGEEQAASALRRLATTFDRAEGGFGGAPKFPPSMVLEWLLRHHERTGSAPALEMARSTLLAMAGGGMHDQAGGGFARYAVDGTWTVPHFEKMLYDNALLLRAYAHLWRVTGDAAAERVARGIVSFLLSDLRTVDGAFASGLDADTDGVEGATYVWTPEQLEDVLGAEDGAFAAAALSVTAAGTFENGASVLQRREEPADPARLDRVLDRLLDARSHRPQSARDDKVLASWNGLVIGALAEAGAVLDEPAWVDAARVAADHVLRAHVVEGRLRRTSRDGVAGSAAGTLDDHANLAEGLLHLAEATGETGYAKAAGGLLDVVLERFGDGHGGFYDTADDAEALIVRPSSPTDNAEPAGASAAASALLRYATHSGSARHREAGLAALGSLQDLAVREPRFAGWALAAMEGVLAGSPEVAVTEGEGAQDLLRVARRHALPGQVTVHGRVGSSPLLEGRGPDGAGRARAFVCRFHTCSAPVVGADELAALLRP